MSDKYYRLVTFLVDIDTSVLRTLFVETARTDTSIGTPFTTIHAYVQARKPTIDKLLKKRKIRQDQYDLIYPSAGTTDVNTWDISLLCALLTGLFGKTLNAVRADIEVIRITRNKLQHAAGTAQLTDTEFNTMWPDLKKATKVLARQAKDNVYEGEIEREIDDSMQNCMPKLGDIFRAWYMDCYAEQSSSFKRKLDDIEHSSKTSANILENVVVKTPNTSGECVKKVKTADQTAIHLRESFRKTIARKLPEDFMPPSEVRDIQRLLCNKHIVVITGYATSPYLATALYVINLKHSRVKCVLLSDGQNWAHIDPEDTDLALFENPFGETEFDIERARNMFDVMGSVFMTARDKDANSQMDVVIVSRTEIVQHIRQNTNLWPDDPVDIVTLCETTTVGRPIDIERDAGFSYLCGKQSDVLRNLLDLTAMILQRQHVQVGDDVIRNAKEAMRQHKVVVLTGRNKDTIEAVVSRLSKSYNIDECLLLRQAEDIKYLSPSRVSLLVANYITGEFMYDCALTRAWFTSLRVLEAIVQRRKLNVVITACSGENLDEALSQYGPHSMLTFRVEVPSTVVVKEKRESPDDYLDATPGNQRSSADAENMLNDKDHKRFYQALKKLNQHKKHHKNCPDVTPCNQRSSVDHENMRNDKDHERFHQVLKKISQHKKQHKKKAQEAVAELMNTENGKQSDSNSTYETRAAFTIEKVIDRGYVYVLYRAKCKTTGNLLALKKWMFNKKTIQDVTKKLESYQKLNHPNVAKYFGSFIEDGYLYSVSELMDAYDFATMIKHHRENGMLMPEITLLKYFKQVCDGLEHMHSLGIKHGHLMPTNVFITTQDVVKLGQMDFDMLFDPTVSTPNYMSPERLSKSPYDFKTEVWSLGCLLYEMTALHSPFENDGNSGRSLLVRKMALDYTPLPPGVWSEQLRSLVTSCLSFEQKHRPDMKSVQADVNKAISDIQNAVAFSNNDASKNNTTATAATN